MQRWCKLDILDTKNREDRSVFIARDLYQLLQASTQAERYMKQKETQAAEAAVLLVGK